MGNKYPVGEENEQNKSPFIESVYEIGKEIGKKAIPYVLAGLFTLFSLSGCKPPPDENKKVEVPTATKKVPSKGWIRTKDSSGAEIYVPLKLFQGKNEKLLEKFGYTEEDLKECGCTDYKIVCFPHNPDNSEIVECELYVKSGNNDGWRRMLPKNNPLEGVIFISRKDIPNHR